MKIGIVGSPGSGKTVFAARLYAEILEQGVNSVRLVTEYAHEHLGMGKPIVTLEDQIYISTKQIEREQYAQDCSFNPIICDSVIWIGGIYASHKFDINETKVKSYVNTVNGFSYDMIVYVPLFKTDSQVNQFRVHDYEESKKIRERIFDYLVNIDEDVEYCPILLDAREQFIKDLAQRIIKKI